MYFRFFTLTLSKLQSSQYITMPICDHLSHTYSSLLRNLEFWLKTTTDTNQICICISLLYFIIFNYFQLLSLTYFTTYFLTSHTQFFIIDNSIVRFNELPSRSLSNSFSQFRSTLDGDLIFIILFGALTRTFPRDQSQIIFWSEWRSQVSYFISITLRKETSNTSDFLSDSYEIDFLISNDDFNTSISRLSDTNYFLDNTSWFHSFQIHYWIDCYFLDLINRCRSTLVFRSSSVHETIFVK